MKKHRFGIVVYAPGEKIPPMPDWDAIIDEKIKAGVEAAGLNYEQWLKETRAEFERDFPDLVAAPMLEKTRDR